MPVRIERLLWERGGRDKWQRSDYIPRTIAAADGERATTPLALCLIRSPASASLELANLPDSQRAGNR